MRTVQGLDKEVLIALKFARASPHAVNYSNMKNNSLKHR